MASPATDQQPWSRRKESALLLGILVLAAVLRLGWPGLTEFKADEARLMTRALEAIRLQQLPLRGISSSVGLPNFPASVWLYALPLAIWQHPYAPTLFTGLLNVLTVWGCWWLARRYWGPQAALAAALLFAVSPWAVVHSRKIWAQDLLSPLVVAWAISAALAFVESRPRYVALHVFLLAFATQVHPAALALLPATLLSLVVFRRRLQWLPLLAGVGLALLSAAPYVYGLWANGGFDLGRALGGNGAPGPFSLLPWRYVLLLITGREIHSLAGPKMFQDYLAQIPPMGLVQVFWALLVLGGAALLTWQIWQRRGQGQRAETALLVLVWLVSPPLFFTAYPGPVALHYLLPVYPAPFIAAGAAVGTFMARWQRRKGIMWAALLVSAGLQVWAWAALLSVVAARSTPGGYGTPLALQLEANDAVRRVMAQTGAGEVLLAGNGDDPGETEFAAVTHALLWDVPHRFVDATHTAVFPAGGAVVLLQAGLPHGGAERYRQVATEEVRVPLRRGEGQLTVLSLQDGVAPEPDTHLEGPPQFANFVKLLGHDRPRWQDGQLQWRLYWQTADSPVSQQYHFFNHLLDGNGQLVAQADGAAFASDQWQQGDVVVSHFTLTVPQEAGGPFLMRAGMYAYPKVENVPVLDVAGNAVGEAVEMGVEGGD